MKHPIGTSCIMLFLSVNLTAACLPDSPATSVQARIEAIDCHERSGDYRKAAALIRALPPSLERDTLHLHLLLLSDSLPAARHFADTASMLTRIRAQQLLWRIRIALFSGKTDECSTLLDSADAARSRVPAAELLEYRYWLLRLADSPEALAKFIQIEYTLYKGDREAAAKFMCSGGFRGETAWRLAIRIARRQLDNSEAEEAQATLRCTPAEKEPEYLYVLAEAEAGSGSSAQARVLLERLMLEFPGNVYSVKGRLLLSRLPASLP